MMAEARVIGVLVRSELRLEARTGDVLRSVLPYALGGLILFALSVGSDAALLRDVGLGIAAAVVLLFGGQAAARRGLLDEAGIRDLVGASGVEPAPVLVARMLTMVVLLSALTLVLAPIAIVLFDPVAAGSGWLLAVVALAVVGLAGLTTIAGALLTSTAVRGVIAPLLVVPLGVPLLLAVTQVPEAVTYGTHAGSWLLLVATIDVVVVGLLIGLARWMESG